MATVILDALKKTFGDAIVATSSDFGDEVAEVKRDKLLEIATFLRDDPAMACDLPCYCTAIDYQGIQRIEVTPTTGMAIPSVAAQPDDDEPRFAMVYEVRSLRHRHRIRLKVRLPEDNPSVPSLAGVWAAMDWLERETFDMYGIQFDGHPDQRRIFMYDEFVGHPLRKDYPKEKRQPLVRREWTDE